MNLPEVAEQFVAVWADPRLARNVADQLTPRETDALADLLDVMGEPEIAGQWRAFNADRIEARINATTHFQGALR